MTSSRSVVVVLIGASPRRERTCVPALRARGTRDRPARRGPHLVGLLLEPRPQRRHDVEASSQSSSPESPRSAIPRSAARGRTWRRAARERVPRCPLAGVDVLRRTSRPARACVSDQSSAGHAVRASRPPGRQTRASSAAVRSWSGRRSRRRRRRRLELGVAVRQLLAVALVETDREPFLLRRAARLRELIGGDVDPDDVRAGPRRPKRHAAGPAGDVENAGARLDREGSDHAIVDRRERLRNALVGRPAPDAAADLATRRSILAAWGTSSPTPPTGARARSRRSRSGCGRDARRVRRPAARARRGLGAAARDRGGPRALLDPLRPAGQREDDARADRRRLDRRRVRGALGRVGDGQGRARGARARPRAARHDRHAHDPLPRRDPPLQQGAAGRAAPRASRRGS